MQVIGTRGPNRPPQITGNRIIFPAFDSLPPGQKITYGVDVQALQPGQAIFQVEVRSANLREPMIQQESTTIYGPNQPTGAAPTTPTAPPPATPPAIPPASPLSGQPNS
jgi:hypothetical protein